VFALLLSEAMNPFYQNISSFPTVIYTVLLILCVCYWLGVALGAIDIELINIDFGSLDMHAASGFSVVDVLGAVMVRMGLSGVPAIVALSFVSLIGWFLSYFAVYFWFGSFDATWVRYLVGIPVLAITLILAMMITAVVIIPLAPLFVSHDHKGEQAMLGKMAVVRTSTVDSQFGEAILDDRGAGIIVKVRSREGEQFAKGDHVILYEKIDEGSVYLVISEDEFGPRGSRS